MKWRPDPIETDDPSKRLFQQLPLERSKASSFPLSWTVVHPIDEESQLADLSAAELEAMDAEFLILLSGFDETFSQVVHTRSSYKAEEILWDVKFANMFATSEGGRPVAIDIGRIHDVESPPPPEE